MVEHAGVLSLVDERCPRTTMKYLHNCLNIRGERLIVFSAAGKSGNFHGGVSGCEALESNLLSSAAVRLETNWGSKCVDIA